MEKIVLGAINKLTGNYIHPKIANKKDNYICPDCNKDLILCQGKIRNPYFRHKMDTINPCNYYDNPGESEIHKDAKLLLKYLLEKKITLIFTRKCVECKHNEEFEIPKITDTSTIQLEYRFEHGELKIADVAYLDDNDIFCIFEICNTHKTCSEDRPEPWFEINAEELIRMANNDFTSLKIPCIRCEKCEECIKKEKLVMIKKEQALNILYDWFNTGVQISPFNDFTSGFNSAEKNGKSEATDELFDIILYENFDDDERPQVDRYLIRLINNLSECYFSKEHEYADFRQGVYYLNIEWVLSQTTMPEQIQYVASLDNYNPGGDDLICKNCGCDYPFWIKTIKNENDYKINYVGFNCCDKNKECNYINCKLCYSKVLICITQTNINKMICKSCDIMLYSSNKIYLLVPYREKDDAKKFGAFWDITYKKWFVYKNNKNIDIILNKWKKM